MKYVSEFKKTADEWLNETREVVRDIQHHHAEH